MNNDNELNKLIVDDTPYLTQITTKFSKRKAYSPVNLKKVCAVIPGIILEIYVKKGEIVQRGDKLLTLEAMKMKNVIVAQASGPIKSVCVENGVMVTKGQLLLEIE
ncbi:MAG: acetyl-CoA carboxylase biotin carboxyl carrier protein subunit [Clostridiales bacterium]